MFHEVLHAPLVRNEIYYQEQPGRSPSMPGRALNPSVDEMAVTFSRTDFRIVSVVIAGYLGTW